MGAAESAASPMALDECRPITTVPVDPASDGRSGRSDLPFGSDLGRAMLTVSLDFATPDE
jgi:hypothetical protein